MSESKSNPSPFERMAELARRVVSTPKAEVDRREREWKKKKAKKAQAE